MENSIKCGRRYSVVTTLNVVTTLRLRGFGNNTFEVNHLRGSLGFCHLNHQELLEGFVKVQTVLEMSLLKNNNVIIIL